MISKDLHVVLAKFNYTSIKKHWPYYLTMHYIDTDHILRLLTIIWRDHQNNPEKNVKRFTNRSTSELPDLENAISSLKMTLAFSRFLSPFPCFSGPYPF